MRIDTITSFRDEHAFLSNFFIREFTWRNQEFKSGEHAFQTAKTSHLSNGWDSAQKLRQQIIDAPTPSKAKLYGRKLPLDTKSWDKAKVVYMREIVHARFACDADLVGRLINTGASMLVEGNDWGDKFWGRCKDEKSGKIIGLNILGVILMEERGYWLYGNPEGAL
jgi:N-glycosidase YbiA